MNTTISDENKVDLFNAMFANEYEVLIQIDLLSGDATTIHASDPVWYRSVGIRYNLETVLSRYVLDHSIDADPEQIISSLKIARIGSQLEHSHVYKVYLTSRNEESAFSLKTLSFYRIGMTQALLTLQDTTEAFHRMSDHVSALEASLRQAEEELEERNAFLTLLSRNLRAPLQSIMGLTQLAEDEAELSGVDAYLEKISMSGTFMSETIEDILDLRRISHGSIELHPERILLGGLFAQLQHLNAQIVMGQGLLYTQEVDIMASTAVMADQHCLRQVIMKLVQCAAACSAKGSRITLRCREQFRSADRLTLVLSVDSRGISLDQERIATMFQPYEPYLGHINENLSTTDITLIILKHYCMALGAKTITAVTDDAKGTRISVALPLHLAEDQRGQIHPSAAPEVTDFTGIRVLLADDNPINLEVGAKVLRSRGMIVTNAVNGREALSRYREAGGAFDVILMDILMPEMDGLEATRQIRAMDDIPGAASIPIIAMTANAFREDFEESLRSGIDAHLVKPIDANRLFEIMSVLLNKKVSGTNERTGEQTGVRHQ